MSSEQINIDPLDLLFDFLKLRLYNKNIFIYVSIFIYLLLCYFIYLCSKDRLTSKSYEITKNVFLLCFLAYFMYIITSIIQFNYRNIDKCNCKNEDELCYEISITDISWIVMFLTFLFVFIRNKSSYGYQINNYTIYIVTS